MGAAMSETERPPEPPANVAPYVRALGPEKAVRLLLAFGGAPAYFSANPQARSRLVQCVGTDGVRALEKEFGNRPGRIPLAKRWIALYLRSEGVSVQEIARRLHTSDFTVRRYVNGESTRQQLSLFDRG